MALVISLAFIIFFNFCLQVISAFHNKSSESMTQSFFWITTLLYIFFVGILKTNEFQIIISLITGIPSVLLLVHIATKYCNLKVNMRAYILICIAGSMTFLLFHWLSFPFWLKSLPVAITTALPLISEGRKIFIQLRKTGYLYYALSIFMIILGLHLLDFPFLRLKPEAALWGFTIYFMIIQSLGLIFPALSLINKDKNYTIELKGEVLKKTKELQDTINLKNITYQVLVHDFSNFIFALKGGTRSIKKTELNKIQSELINKSESILDRMAKLIKKIKELEIALNTGNEGAIHFEYHNLSSLVETLKDTYQSKLETKGIEIVNDTDPSIEVLTYEPFFTTSVLGNYLSNAIKFSKENTEINVLTEYTQDRLYIRIIDKGIGIPKEDLTKVNEANSPRRRKGTHQESGTGLGTLIASNYLRIHGLNVHFDSIVADEANDFIGETTVTITFEKDQFRKV